MSHLSALRSAVSANIRVLFQRQNNQEELVGISQNMQRYKRSFRFFFNRAAKKCQSLVKSLGLFTGKVSKLQTKLSKMLHFASLTDSFIMLDAKLLKPLSCTQSTTALRAR